MVLRRFSIYDSAVCYDDLIPTEVSLPDQFDHASFFPFPSLVIFPLSSCCLGQAAVGTCHGNIMSGLQGQNNSMLHDLSTTVQTGMKININLILTNEEFKDLFLFHFILKR